MPPDATATNTLFYGDNLTILREHIADAGIDLVYPYFMTHLEVNYDAEWIEKDQSEP